MKKKVEPTPLTKEDHKTKDLFVATREILDLSRPELAAELGMTTRAVHFYETGQRVIPKHVQRMMELLKQRHELKKIVGNTEAVNG